MTASTSDSPSATPADGLAEGMADDANLYRTLVETTLDLITIVDRDAVVTYQSPSSERVLGLRPEQMLGCRVLDFFHEDDRETAADAIDRLLAREVEIEEVLLRFRHPDGHWLHLECVGRHWARGGFDGLIVSSRDVSDRHAMLAELESSNEMLSRTFSAARTILTVSLPETGLLVEVNDAWCQTFGYTRAQAVGRTALELGIWSSPEQREEVAGELMREGRLRDREVTLYTRDGAPRLMLLDGEMLTVADQQRFLMSATDITEARRTETELRQSQKMEAVGQLTGGVAHDFNNLLGVILGNAELLQHVVGHLPQVQRYVSPILRACDRGASLTQQLLAFSRRQSLAPERVQLDEVLRRMQPILRTTVRENTRVQVLAPAGIWPCDVDPGQFESAVLNLALNARDAMPSGGQLEVRIDNVHFTRNAPAGLPPGDYVAVKVRDTGVGMDAAVQQHVFEPFFTTKEPGRGTGLGLSMVFGFVSQSGGTVTLDSVRHHGTTVTLLLPRSVASTEPGTVDRGVEGVPRARAGETVLVLEDNDALRRLAVEQLQALGYTVLEAADESDLMRQLADGVRPQLMISDVLLTGRRRGPELAALARARLPSLAVLFMSGYLDSDVGMEVDGPVLAKPFTRVQFADAVRQALDARRTG